MECKITSTRTRPGPTAALTLLEVMIASGVGLLVLLVVTLLAFFSGRSFVAMTNYIKIDQHSQLALDKMSREIRQAHSFTACSPTSISFLDKDYNLVQFAFDPQARTLVRTSGTNINTYLTECDSLQFANFSNQSISNTFDVYQPAHVTDTRMLQVTWTCS